MIKLVTLYKQFGISRHKLLSWLNYYDYEIPKPTIYKNKKVVFFEDSVIDFLNSHKQPTFEELCLKSKINNFGTYENYVKHMTDTLHKSMVEKYGENYTKDIYHKKSLEGKIKKYESYDNYVEHFRNKVKQCWNDKSIDEINEIVEKRENTCLDKYGVKNTYQLENSYKNRLSALYSKYNGTTYFGTDEFKSKNELEKVEFENRDDILTLDQCNDLLNRWSVRECCMELNILKHERVGNQTRSYILKSDFPKLENYILNISSSKWQDEMCDWIQSICNFTIYKNNRTIIKPKELDITIPEKKIAIECDGIYYHSDKFVDENYHINKTIDCENLNYKLLHIYDDEWRDKQEIVKSIIKSSLGIYDRKIFARKCEVKEISDVDFESFCNQNNIYGYLKSDYCLGLFYNDELLQVIGFNYLSEHTEITRMCTLLNTQVVGGFSKLMKHFGKECVGFIDRRLFDGLSCSDCNFEIIDVLKPTFKYVYRSNRYDRLNENMDNYHLIYDCGKIKVKYLINK